MGNGTGKQEEEERQVVVLKRKELQLTPRHADRLPHRMARLRTTNRRRKMEG